MASALIGGIIESKLADSHDILVSDINPKTRDYLEAEFTVQVTDDNSKVAGDSDLVILAVKPQNLADVGRELQDQFKPNCLLISILAGKPVSVLKDTLGASLRIIRVMPNLPALVGSGITSIVECPEDPKGQEIAEKIFKTVGQVVVVPEKAMDAVTALAGSGPGFVYAIMEAFIEGGRKLGLSTEAAQQLTIGTFAGACELILKHNEKPEYLRRRVTSPGGTTEAGLKAFADDQLQQTIVDGLHAAAKRSQELSRPE